jgi:hypothetical protein
MSSDFNLLYQSHSKKISEQKEKFDEQMQVQTNLTNESRCLSNGYLLLNNGSNVIERGMIAIIE